MPDTDDPDPDAMNTPELMLRLDDACWTGVIDTLEPLLQQVTAATWMTVNAEHAGTPLPPVEVSMVLTNDPGIQELNDHYRRKDQPTNVLSFPQYETLTALLKAAEQVPDGELLSLGDVVLAYDTLAREAEEQGKTFNRHTAHMLVHGLLHLLGFDHEQVGDAAIMEALEIRILARQGIANPYQLVQDADLKGMESG